MQGSKQQKKEKYNCRFFIQGTCKNGTNCKFMHPVNASSQQKNPNNDKKIQEKKTSSLKQISNDISQQMNSMNIEPSQSKKKHARDEYCQGMIETMKMECFSCKKKELPVYLSCGCSSICESCANNSNACSKQNHNYDPKIYIK